jgi:flagellar assembly factor FliW
MPSAQTEQFGELHYTDDVTLTFPRGLPGFESCRKFVILDEPRLAPLLHLQSLEIPALCFLALPVRTLDAAYETMLSAEDRDTLGVSEGQAATLDLAMLAVATDGQLTANLMAPVVIDLSTRRAVQAVRSDARYSHQHEVRGTEDSCS